MIFKIFKRGMGSCDQLESDVNTYLNANPGITPSNVQMSVYNGTIYLGVFFVDCPPLPQMPKQIGAVPSPWPLPQEILCSDPWHGEFIPVGDPPIRHVSYEKNSAEQFGGGVH